MATPLDLPLSEITSEEFQQVWTQFELVAVAKEWSDNRKWFSPQSSVVSWYVEADNATRGNLTDS